MASYYRTEYYCNSCKQTFKTKKCNQCGNIKTEGRGAWGVRFRTIENGIKINKNLSNFKTKSEAEVEFLRLQLLNNESTNHTLDGPHLELSYIFERFLESKRREWEKSSYTDYIHIYKKHIHPYFDKKINKITRNELINWQNELTDAGYSYKYKSKIRGYLFSLFKYAEIEYSIANTFRNIPAFSKKNLPPRKINFWVEDEFLLFISVIDDIEYKTLFSFLYLMGTRKGEALSLKWSDIDLSSNIALINKTLSRSSGLNLDGKSSSSYTIRDGTKTSTGIREIAMPKNLITLILDYKNYLITNNNYDDNNFVFGGKKFIKYSTLENRMQKYVNMSKVKKIRIHDLRHSHVSLIINRYISTSKYTNALQLVMLIAQRIGDKPEEVMKTYGHLFPNEANNIVESLNIEI